MNTRRRIRIAMAICVFIMVVGGGKGVVFANEPPVAEAGLPRYAALEPVQLDGSGSYDPDGSGPLSYAWTQISGPPLVITGADTATPQISGFVQTEEIQECEFELVVKDGQSAGVGDSVKVVIVPSFTGCTMALENPVFDPQKPTIVFFDGGVTEQLGGGRLNSPTWSEQANIISFPVYVGDPGTFSGKLRDKSYQRPANQIIVYLSAVAPSYRQPIQTFGFSVGGLPALDVALRLNMTYADGRYAVNHVALGDPSSWIIGVTEYRRRVAVLLDSPVGGESCWVDCYEAENVGVSPSALNVVFPPHHELGKYWYHDSLVAPDSRAFNHGVVAGAYWSVAGPGRNLQLALTPGIETYKFRWVGSATVGRMELYDELVNPGRLPEPVSLGAWVNRLEGSGDIDGAVLSCDECENAVGYQLLFGSDPYRVMDFTVVSDTPFPPTDVIRDLPSEETWWTVRARDVYGSTIHADPIPLDLASLPPMSVENTRTGKRYVRIGHAIRDTEPGDVILLNPATYDEHIELAGRILTLRSLDPNDPMVVAATIIRGKGSIPTVAIAGPESEARVLDGLTIFGQAVAISCQDACPKIARCTVESDGPNAIEFWEGYEPTIVDCNILGEVIQVKDPRIVAFWKFDEAAGMVAYDSAGQNNAAIMGLPLWQPEGGKIGGAIQFSGVSNFAMAKVVHDPSEAAFGVFAWVKGGGPGQVVISQQGGANWLMADGTTGALMTGLSKSGRTGSELASEAVITDGDWHRIGFTWDGRSRALCVDGVEVAQDTQESMAGSTGNVTIGAGTTLAPGTFWSGLIDDVRIYDRAVKP